MTNGRGHYARPAIAIFICLALLVTITPIPAQSIPYYVYGTVYDQYGLPLPGATVNIANTATGNSADVVSDAAGQYTYDLNYLPGGYGDGDVLNVTVLHSGHPGWGQGVVDISLGGTNIDLTLAGYAVQGYAYWLDGLTPLAGANVDVRYEGTPETISTSTDASGYYAVDLIDLADGYNDTVALNVTVSSAFHTGWAVSSVDLAVRPRWVNVTARGHLVQGMVDDDGTPVSGASVTVRNDDTGESLVTTTDATGGYLLDLANASLGFAVGNALNITVDSGGKLGWNDTTIGSSWRTWLNASLVGSRVTLAATVPPTAEPGETTNVTFYLNNTGTGSTGQLWLKATLGEMIYVSDTSSDIGGSRTAASEWSFPALDVGQHSFALTLQTPVLADGTPVYVNATLEYQEYNGDPRNPSQSNLVIVTSRTVLELSATLNRTGIGAGEEATLTIFVNNTGSRASANVSLNLTISLGLQADQTEWEYVDFAPGSMVIPVSVNGLGGIAEDENLGIQVSLEYTNLTGTPLPPLGLNPSLTGKAPAYGLTLDVMDWCRPGQVVTVAIEANNTGSRQSSAFWLNASLNGEFTISSAFPETDGPATDGVLEWRQLAPSSGVVRFFATISVSLEAPNASLISIGVELDFNDMSGAPMAPINVTTQLLVRHQYLEGSVYAPDGSLLTTALDLTITNDRTLQADTFGCLGGSFRYSLARVNPPVGQSPSTIRLSFGNETLRGSASVDVDPMENDTVYLDLTLEAVPPVPGEPDVDGPLDYFPILLFILLLSCLILLALYLHSMKREREANAALDALKASEDTSGEKAEEGMKDEEEPPGEIAPPDDTG